MSPISHYQPDEWVFITTTPTRPRPTKEQRSQVRRRVMREIGYTRRNPHTAYLQSPSTSSCISSDTIASASSSSTFSVDPQSGSPQGSDCPPSSAHIPSFLTCPWDRESQRLLHHSVLRCDPEPISDIQRPLVSNMHHESRRVRPDAGYICYPYLTIPHASRLEAFHTLESYQSACASSERYRCYVAGQ
jgi:hypothetical protein